MRALLAVALYLAFAAPAAADAPPEPGDATVCSLDAPVADCQKGSTVTYDWSDQVQHPVLSSGLSAPVTWTANINSGVSLANCTSAASCTVDFKQDTIGNGGWAIVRATSGNSRRYFLLFMESRWHYAYVAARGLDGQPRDSGTVYAVKGGDPQQTDCTAHTDITPATDPAGVVCVKGTADSTDSETGKTVTRFVLPAGSQWTLHTGNATSVTDNSIPKGLVSAPHRFTTSTLAVGTKDVAADQVAPLKPLAAGTVTFTMELGTSWLIYDTHTTATLTMKLTGGEAAIYGFWEDGNGLRLKDLNKPQNQATDTVEITEPSGLPNQFVLVPGQSRSVTYDLKGTLAGLAKLQAGAKWNPPGTTLYTNVNDGPQDLEVFYADDNTKVATLHVKKIVSPASDVLFPFSLAHAGGATTPFSVAGGTDKVYTLPPSGTYTLSEGAFPGFSLLNGAPMCETDAPDKVSFGSAASGTTIAFADNAGAPGVSCTFTNVADGTVGPPTGGGTPSPTPGGPNGGGTPTPAPGRTATITVTKPKKIKPNKKFSLGVKVAATGATPTGTVKLAKGKKGIGTVTLAKGRATFKFKLNAGTSKLKVSYLGSATVAPAGKTVTIKIKKPKRKHH